MILFDLAWSFIVGAWLAGAERLLAAELHFVPDVAALALAWLLTGPLRRRAGTRVLGLLLGFSTASLDPLGAWLLGGGIAAVVLVPLREIVFIESAGTQAIFGLLCGGALAAGRTLYALFGDTPLLAWTPRELAAPLLAAVALPILRKLCDAVTALARRARARFDERRRGGPAPSAG